MKKIIHIVIAFVLILIGTSCEDFLQKDPPSSPSQSIYWQKKSDYESALAGCYSIVYSWPGVMSQIMACYDNLTDNSIAQHDETTYGRSKTMALGDISSNSDGYVVYVYYHCYQGISRVHTLMENLQTYKGTDMTDSEKKFMLAQCKALRGYFYSWLYQCYREVPLVTESLTTDNMYKAKASRSEIYSQINKDFDEAINELPDKVYSDSEVSGRFTPSAVKVLKARLMLAEAYGEDGVADAQKMAEIVPILESIKGYSLAPSLRDNFISSKQLTSPELIFSVRYLAPNLTNSMDLYYAAWGVCCVTRDLVDEFECTDGLKWGESPLTETVDESIIYSTDGTQESAMIAERNKLFKNRDRRLSESIYHSGYASFIDDGYENVKISSVSSSPSGFSVLKLIQPMNTIPGYETVSDADVVIVRYAHVLLMIAEAENEANGPTQKVYDAINKVRERSAQPDLPTGLNQAKMRECIRHEWRIETCFEGLRYFQMKRWKILDKVNGMEDPGYKDYKKVFKPEFYYWPIPQSEIDKAGGTLIQDPNY